MTENISHVRANLIAGLLEVTQRDNLRWNQIDASTYLVNVDNFTAEVSRIFVSEDTDGLSISLGGLGSFFKRKKWTYKLVFTDKSDRFNPFVVEDHAGLSNLYDAIEAQLVRIVQPKVDEFLKKLKNFDSESL